MKTHFLITTIILSICLKANGQNLTRNHIFTANDSIVFEVQDSSRSGSIQHTTNKETDFLPEGYIVHEKIYGDLNKDKIEDCILIIKGTDLANLIQDDYGNEYDGNRRGIIVLLNKKNTYELASKNYNCFSSGNEDGGVYFPPELSIEIEEEKLHINYSHGRYGYWGYTFRFQNLDFELIGYDASSNRGPVVNYETSINFSTKKKIVNRNTNESAEGGDEVFEKSVTNIKRNKLIKLSEIEDFDGFEVSE